MTFGIIIGGRKRERDLKRSGSYEIRDVKSSSFSKIERDPVMVRHIRSGKIDNALKRDAVAIERENENNRKAKLREKDQKDLHEMKKEYGLLPEQLKRNANRS